MNRYPQIARKLGRDGDFVTAPELGPVFARCVVDAVAPVLRGLGSGARFFEIGGGSGAFAVAAMASAVIGLAGPGRAGGEELRSGRGAEVLILMDRSSSMDANVVPKDVKAGGQFNASMPTKSDVVRGLLSQFVAKRPDDRFAFMAFSTSALRIVPFTDDHALVQAALAATGVGRGLPDTLMGKALLAIQFVQARNPHVELAAIAEAEEEEARTLTRRRQAAESAAAELVDTNEQLSLSLVRNVEERGLALIEAERRALVQRLDVYALEGQARQDAQDAVAEYVLLRQRQLTEELKPEWQRMLEAWADTQEAMKRRSDEFQTDFLTGSKETFREFIRDGEINLKRFSDLLVNTLADQVFEQSLAPAVGQLGNFIARSVGLGGGTAQAGGGLAAQTAQTTALSSSTAAITANAAQTVQATGSLGLLSSVAQAAAEALSLVASQAASGAGGGGGGILGSLASAFAGFFTGPSAVTSAVYSPALPVGTPLPSLGGRRAGGPTRSGGYYEVAEEDEPELYRVGRRTYLLNPGQGEVTPARPLRVEGGAAGGQAPSAGNTYVEVINNGGGQVREERSRQGPDEFVRIVIERAVSQIAGDIRGGVGPVSSSLGAIGVGRQAALR